MADVHTTLWTRRVYASAKGARHLELFLDYTLLCRRRRCLPMYLPPYCPCTVSHLHATISHSRRLSCIACHSFQRFFSPKIFSSARQHFLYNSDSHATDSCRVFFFLVHATVSHTLFVHFENVRKLICSLFWPKKLESSAQRKKQKTRFKLPSYHEKQRFSYLFKRWNVGLTLLQRKRETSLWTVKQSFQPLVLQGAVHNFQ
jgi:hypothetical protein